MTRHRHQLNFQFFEFSIKNRSATGRSWVFGLGPSTWPKSGEAADHPRARILSSPSSTFPLNREGPSIGPSTDRCLGLNKQCEDRQRDESFRGSTNEACSGLWKSKWEKLTYNCTGRFSIWVQPDISGVDADSDDETAKGKSILRKKLQTLQILIHFFHFYNDFNHIYSISLATHFILFDFLSENGKEEG